MSIAFRHKRLVPPILSPAVRPASRRSSHPEAPDRGYHAAEAPESRSGRGEAPEASHGRMGALEHCASDGRSRS